LHRELFSYKFPANGLGNLPTGVSVEVEETIDLCRLLVDIAQFNSVRLDQSFEKNCKGKSFGFNEKILEKLVFYQTEDYLFTDDEDGYRISRIIEKKKKKRPGTVYDIMSAGMIEDFFGAWTKDENEGTEEFDPYHDWRLIFDFP
jgi:hypothetical protein